MRDSAKFSINHYYKSSIKFDFWRPLAEKLELRHFRFNQKIGENRI
jgi:hypothetical protein